MKKSNVFIMLLGILLTFSACITSWNGMPKYVDPEFDGGPAGWSNYIQQNLRYPISARSRNISGSVMTSFVVNKEGKVVDAKVLKGIGGGCDEEALRVLLKSPLWRPGYRKGKPVCVEYTMPFSFKLTERKNR